MPKIAIIRSKESMDRDGDYHVLMCAISEWDEVTENELIELRTRLPHYQNGFYYSVIERVNVDAPEIINSVAKAKKEVALMKAKMEKEEAERKKKSEERKLKKLAKDRAAREALFKTLKEEFQ